MGLTQEFDLLTVIERAKNGIDKKNLNNKHINQLALKIKFQGQECSQEDIVECLTACYIVCAIARKVKKFMKNAYVSYTKEEDFLSLFYLAFLECIEKYDVTKGDFQNLLSKTVDCYFKNTNKSGFLKVTGSIKKENRKPVCSVNVDDYLIGSKSMFQHESEIKLMNEELVKKLSSTQEGQMLLYKYLTRPKPFSNQQVACAFGLTEKQVRTRLKRASEDFKNNNEDFLRDYFYDSDNLGETIAVQTA